DVELDMADTHNYITYEMLGKLGFVRVDYGDYSRRMVKEVRIEIHGFNFLVDFVVIDYANEGLPSIVFGRNFLVTTKCKGYFGLGEIRIDLTMLEAERDIDNLLVNLVEDMDEVGCASSELVKMVYHPLSPKQKENILEALDRKYKELKEKKPIVEILENYMTYRKKLDKVIMGRARLGNKEFGDKNKEKLIKNGLTKKICDPGNFVLPICVNRTTQMSALADTGASVSVLPFILYKNLGLCDLSPYHSNITIVDNTQEKELPLLLGHPFLHTCGAIINMGRETMTIDDGVIRHTYFPKPRAKTYLENVKVEEEYDWLGCFKVGRDEDGNPKYGPMTPLFLEIEDEMERALAMEAYFNPFKNIIIFKKLIDFLGSLSVQLKHADW
ncbi:DNA-directed DNA polymerase, partial [Tanacetum coccineum]